MKFLELNKKRHATKHFTDKPVDPKDVRTAIEIATLAPSAHNSQPWKFVVVREKNAELAKLAYGSNFEQVSSAPVTIALFTDTDLAKRARKIARVGGAKNFSEEQKRTQNIRHRKREESIHNIFLAVIFWHSIE